MSIDLSQYQELYLTTSKELINTMKMHIEDLKKDMSDTHAIAEFHRAAHSLKSQSLVMGFEQLGQVNRQLEAFFLMVKEHEFKLTEQYIHMISQIVNHVEHAVTDIDKSEHEPDLSEDIKTLKQHTNITS